MEKYPPVQSAQVPKCVICNYVSLVGSDVPLLQMQIYCWQSLSYDQTLQQKMILPLLSLYMQKEDRTKNGRSTERREDRTKKEEDGQRNVRGNKRRTRKKQKEQRKDEIEKKEDKKNKEGEGTKKCREKGTKKENKQKKRKPDKLRV
jgi:hypothetical protein